MPEKTVAAATLGCKVNFYETEAMLALFKNAGYRVVDFSDKAAVYIINTCTVTNLGGKKSRQMIRRAAAANPEAVIAAVGCYVQESPEAAAAIAGVDILIGTADRLKIVEMVESRDKSQKGAEIRVSGFGAKAEYEGFSVSETSGRQRAFVKIQDGCDRYCAYCVIPYVRGPVRSRPLAGVMAEAERLAASGRKEIVLSGIHLSSYGKDLSGEGLIDVIKSVSGIAGLERIRLGSIEPGLVTEEFVGEIGRLPKLCDHFHLSLQSGCDKTLRNMNRRYLAADYAGAVSLLKSVWPGAAVTTDIIAGFPGETEADFRESLAFCESVGLAKIHVFPFSPKKGTRAFDMPGQVGPRVKAERAAEFLALSEKLSREFALGFAGRVMPVLFEEEIGNNNQYFGYTTNYIGVVKRFEEICPVNGILPVMITEDCVYFSKYM